MGLLFSKPSGTDATHDSKSQAKETSLSVASSSSAKAANTEASALTILPKGEPEEVILFDWLPCRDVSGIIGSYYNFDCKEIADAKHNSAIKDFKQHRPIVVNPNLTWYGQHILYVGLAGHCISYGNADAMRIILACATAAIPNTATAAAKPTKTADILSTLVQSQDHRGRRVEETLLGTAVIVNSVDPLPDMKVPHGFAEQIAASGHMTSVDVKTTLDRVRPTLAPGESPDSATSFGPKNNPYWQRATDKRMQRFEVANKKLGEAVIKGDAPLDGNVEKREACDAVIQYRKEIAIDPNEVIRMGVTMDLMVAVSSIQFLIDNLGQNRFGGFYTDKANVFLIVAFGTMLGLAAADDAHVVNHGSHRVVEDKECPPRSLTLKDGSPYYSSGTRGLGFTLFLDSFGGLDGVWAWTSLQDTLENLCRTKTSGLHDLCNSATLRQARL